MATESTPADGGNDEQSMEEILQSIRRIIAEEEDADKNAAPASIDDVLELTDLVESAEEPSAGAETAMMSMDELMASFDNPPPAEEPEIVEPEPEIDIMASILAEPEPVAPEPEAEPEIDQTTVGDFVSQALGEALVSDATAAAAAPSIRSIQELAHKAAQPRHPALLFRSGTTVEDLMLEALRPMLKDWLDANLPTTVERIVQREIHRIVESAGDL